MHYKSKDGMTFISRSFKEIIKKHFLFVLEAGLLALGLAVFVISGVVAIIMVSGAI